MAAIGTDLTKITTRNGKSGAGGIVTRLARTASGKVFCRTDTYGFFIYNFTTNIWEQTVAPGKMPSGDIGPGAYYAGDERGTGGYEIDFCYNSPLVGYKIFLGFCFKTTDGGATWTKTAMTGQDGEAANANKDPSRQSGPYLRVDPNDSNHVIVVFYKGNPLRTTDGGANWTAITSVGASGDSLFKDPMMVEVARGSGTTSGRTSIWYIWRPQQTNKLYKSTDGGATWSAVGSVPITTCNYICCDGGNPGVLWLAPNSGSSVVKYDGTSFTSIAGNLDNANPVQFVSVKHDANNTILLGHTGGAQSISTTGTSFTGLPAPNPIVGGDITWVSWTLNNSKTSGNGIWLDNGKYWMGMGTGVLEGTVPTTSVQFNWTDRSLGIEQLIFRQLICPPIPINSSFAAVAPFGKTTIVGGCEDRYVIPMVPGTIPATHGPNNLSGSGIGQTFCLDYAKDDPTFVAAVCEKGEASTTGVFTSTYPWTTWTKTATNPPLIATGSFIGGGFAMGRKTDMVWFPAANSRPQFTNNGGATWNYITFPGEVPTTGEQGWGFAPAIFFDRHIVCADTVNIDTFYAYNYITPGFYRSTDRANTWTRLTSSTIQAFGDGYGAQLYAVPGKAGHLYWVGGAGGSLGPEDGYRMFRSTDGGSSWAGVLNSAGGISEPICMGFGKNLPGASYPAIAYMGYYNNLWGLYVSLDNFATPPTRVVEYPGNNWQIPHSMTGDPNYFGVWNIAFGGAGYVTTDFSGALIHCT